tara:strand:+ start:490 stop:1677 length:1188 start_codon:yes stop_codon:yes gene_type:complete
MIHWTKLNFFNALNGKLFVNIQDNNFSVIKSDLPTLLQIAAKIRDDTWGKEITYSRKVFIPLTNMCRDTCSYCTFVKHPSKPDARILTPEQVLFMAKQGEAHGCKEVLFSLGEKPELRYPEAKKKLALLGYNRMTSYLRDMCELILDKTSLLPHVNAGTLSNQEIDELKPVSASMGMMLETITKRLSRKGGPHYACPDKTPIQRLRTLSRVGNKKVPFTTGLLIGIGETFEERIEALEEINRIHAKHGNIQEVIIQNFRKKPDIKMANHPEPTLEAMLRTIAAARIILNPEISLQAPPNLSDRHIKYIQAGINDWGGISPVTIDFINPEHAWPDIEKLRTSCNKAGYKLNERLTVYPKYIKSSERFLNTAVSKKIEKILQANIIQKSNSQEFIKC